VVEHGGFASAGRALGLPKSKLSRRVAALEERLGVRLIQRSTRRFSVTEVGADYYRHCQAMIVEAEAAQEAIDRMRASPRGVVRLACPTGLLHSDVSRMLAGFMMRWPEVEVHLDATNRRVDVVGERLDLAIRVRFPPLEDSDLTVRILGDSRQRLVASPRCLSQADHPKGPADLHGLPSLAWGPVEREHSWILEHETGAGAVVRHHPILVTDDMAALRDAAVAGVGVVQLPLTAVREALAAGDLVDLLPGWAPRSGVIHAVFPSRRGMLPSVRALIDHLADGFAGLEEAG
jgi:DNA-binding transcriptional LysR family regulator